MKALLLLALISSTAFAASEDVTCLNYHTEEAEQKFSEIYRQSISAMLAKKGITLDAEKSDFSVTAGTTTFTYDGTYGYVSISSMQLVTASGTELTAEYRQSLWNSTEIAWNAYFKPVLKSKGFDKEGNAIAARCILVSDKVRVDDRADFIQISNTRTGKVIGKVNLPTSVTIY